MALITFADLETPTRTRYAKRLMEKSAASLLEEQEDRLEDDASFDVFLSHSYHDAKLDKMRLLGIKALLEDFNLSVYVDWLTDSHLDRGQVTAKTARVLRTRMDHSRCLLFATSENSQNSRWMPWELGYMDGKNGKVAVLPLVATTGQTLFLGQEYLGLYYYVDMEATDTSEYIQLWVNQDATTYVSFAGWLRDKRPTPRHRSQ